MFHGTSLSDLDDDLAEMTILFHHPVRFDDFVQGKDLFNDRHDSPVGKLRQSRPGELGDYVGLVLDRTGAEHRADDLLPLDHHQGKIELRLDAADDADDHQPAGIAEGVHIRRQVLGADMVENDVDTLLGGKLLDRLGEVGRLLEVDHQIDPHPLDPLQLVGRGGDDQFRIRHQRLAELHPGHVDAAAAPMNDGRVVVLEAADHEQVEEGGDIGLTDAGRLLEAHARRNRHQVAGVGNGIFGIGAAADQSHHPVADLPAADAIAKLCHGPGYFQPENGRIAGRRGIVAHPLHEIGAVYRGGMHLDKNLSRTGSRLVRLADLHYLNSAETVHQNSFHICPPLLGMYLESGLCLIHCRRWSVNPELNFHCNGLALAL